MSKSYPLENVLQQDRAEDLHLTQVFPDGHHSPSGEGGSAELSLYYCILIQFTEFFGKKNVKEDGKIFVGLIADRRYL